MPVMNMFPGGSTLQIPLEACTAFSASAGNAKVELTWTDPKDKYATPEGDISDTGDQLVSEWDHTVLVRKTACWAQRRHRGGEQQREKPVPKYRIYRHRFDQ